MRGYHGLLIVMLLFGLISSSGIDATEKAKLKGLIVSGGCCHDYPNQGKIISEGMSQRVNIKWDIIVEGIEGNGVRDHKISIYQDPDWAKKYDVIVHNECFGGVSDAKFLEGIVNAHHAGVPAIFIHCSLHSYRSAGMGADGWRELIGVTSTSHEKHRPVLVKKINDEHPIMRGFPAEWKTPNGELYKIEHIWPNCIPLAKAYGEDTKKNHTVIWANTFGKAKVFGTSLGHHNETMNTEVWLDLVSRGLLWTVNQLEPDGTPSAGYGGTGVKPIVIEAPPPKPDPNFQKP
ncbi:MAG TPA: ThuA domain-containing protein [Planctomycetaceae bacterium]|nr:ThuA domain-containing protein [Planctomycetaceae bacterium]